MTALLATGAGRGATARTVRWPAIGALVALAVSTVVATGVAGVPAAHLGAELALRLVAVAIAFTADDPIAEAAPATPIAAGARLVARVALALPVVVLAWVVVAAAAPAGGEVVAGVVTGTAALTLAVIIGRRSAVVSPGAVAAAAVLSMLALDDLLRMH